jgi:hypothetical protein
VKKVITLSLLVFLALACVALAMGRKPDGPVPFTVILSGAYSKCDSFKVDLIQNEDNWKNTWQLAKGNEEPLPTIPTVDFRKENVVAAFMGARNSSGYKIEITDLVKKGNILRVSIKKYETPGMLPVITRPFTLIRIPKGDYKLEVVEESVQ